MAGKTTGVITGDLDCRPDVEAKRDPCGRIWIEIGTKGRGTDAEKPLRVEFPILDRKIEQDLMWDLANVMALATAQCGIAQLELE